MTKQLLLTLHVISSLVLKCWSATISIEPTKIINRINDRFICFTLDWWPPEKTDFCIRSWENASILNLDLENTLFKNAVSQFSPVHLRLGGSLADNIHYLVGSPAPGCDQMTTNPKNGLGFEGGCLTMQRWDKLNQFCQRAGCGIIFQINELNGRIQSGSDFTIWEGEWDSDNARDFLKYVSQIQDSSLVGLELGNELIGPTGVQARLEPNEVASDFLKLKEIISEIFPDKETRPMLIGPDGKTFDDAAYSLFLEAVGDSLDVLTWHVYSLGGGDPFFSLVDNILDINQLDNFADLVARADKITSQVSPELPIWVGEGGGVANSGQHLATDAFVSGFWWLDQIGTLAKNGHQSYCRQSLVGGNYGLLNTATFQPHPDYYSSLLFKRLMGDEVLSITPDPIASNLRVYSHCLRSETSNVSGGITLLLINLGEEDIEIQIPGILPSETDEPDGGTERKQLRREYIFSNDDLRSQETFLNGQQLKIHNEQIPELNPSEVDNTEQFTMKGLTYGFVVLPDAAVAVCTHSGDVEDVKSSGSSLTQVILVIVGIILFTFIFVLVTGAYIVYKARQVRRRGGKRENYDEMTHEMAMLNSLDVM